MTKEDLEKLITDKPPEAKAILLFNGYVQAMSKYQSESSTQPFKGQSCTLIDAVRSASPCPLPRLSTTQRLILTTSCPGTSGYVRVYPDSFLLCNSETYVACPGRPGKSQHITRARARTRVFRLLFSDLLFILLLKTPGQPGQLFKIHNLHPDSRPDAPGQPGRITIGGLSCR